MGLGLRSGGGGGGGPDTDRPSATEARAAAAGRDLRRPPSGGRSSHAKVSTCKWCGDSDLTSVGSAACKGLTELRHLQLLAGKLRLTMSKASGSWRPKSSMSTHAQVMLWDDANADAMPVTAAAASAMPHMLPASNVATAAADTGGWTSYDVAPGTPRNVIRVHIYVPIVDSCHHLIVTPPVLAQLFTLCLQCTRLYAILSDACNATSGSSAAEEGRTSRSHSSRLRIAALTADNLAALEPRRRSDPRGTIGGASAGPPRCTLLCGRQGVRR